MRELLVADELRNIAERSQVVCGAASLLEELAATPDRIYSVSDPSVNPLDVAAYRNRLERSYLGFGPAVHGLTEFVAFLERQSEAVRVVSVRGSRTSYV